MRERDPHLQVVRKLLPSGIARVHCNENCARGVQHNFCSLKHKLLQLHNYSLLDAEHLLRYHRQHLQLDAVELIKAGPSTGLGQPFEELPHGLVVQAIRAVEYNTLQRRSRGRRGEEEREAEVMHGVCACVQCTPPSVMINTLVPHSTLVCKEQYTHTLTH